MTYLSQNFDIHNVFEFLRISASEPDNKEAMRESYWIIVYIYLRKIAWDISDSFQNEKTKAMLQSVNPHDFTFSQGFLVHEKTQKKIDLSCFVQTAIEEAQEKAQYLALNNMHNLTKVNRIKSEDRLLSDYPHFYSLKMEGREDVRLHGMRNSENGEFIISSIQGNFTLYGRGFLGIVQPNFLGTKFEVYDFGIEPGYIQTTNLPRDFLPVRKRVSTIEYDTNFFAEKPRSFRVSIVEEQKGQHPNERHLENLAPRFNEQRGCYTLNFYGRVSKASARNFQLIETDGDEDEIILSHGKFQRNEFNLDFRAPVNQLVGFAVSLSAIGKKRVVG
ncbi:hypothetical protein FGO68_gene8617 [Halteria grandinella]|uniref:Tubby C-terminal domain-containing protein n=1 Tax=Halteria grandinella TaxID=5974 RepID=A0A8J8P5L7_HALGN|nr:hypothetical protein FGO68_gene8617 [Halteria grandinella]